VNASERALPLQTSLDNVTSISISADGETLGALCAGEVIVLDVKYRVMSPSLYEDISNLYNH